MSCLTSGSITSGDQWNALLAAGLHRVYIDIILTDEIYHDVRTRNYLSTVMFGLAIILPNLTKKDEDNIDDLRNPIVSNEVIDRTVELWDFIWARRSILQEDVDENLYRCLLGQLTLRWSTAVHLSAHAPAYLSWTEEHTSIFTQTRIGHVAFYIWQYTKRPNSDDDATLSLLTLSLSSSRSDKDQLVQEAVVDTFGHHLFVDQLNRDLQDQTLIGIKLYQLMRFLAVFAAHPATKWLALEQGTYKFIFPAIRRQRGESEEVLWKTIRWAVEPLVWAFKECDREVLIELVEQHGMMKLMSRAMIFGAKHAVDPEDLGMRLPRASDSKLILVSPFWHVVSGLVLSAEAVSSKNEDRRNAGSRGSPPVYYIDERYTASLIPNLGLRAIASPVKNQSAHQRAISDWEEFGYYLSLQESMFSGNGLLTKRRHRLPLPSLLFIAVGHDANSTTRNHRTLFKCAQAAAKLDIVIEHVKRVTVNK
ncbi:hypothetical protein HETIRDRAFT_425936 [Heterobasidion irregulare TC 32-1]|uniref:Uncharacterized protein n=1 Tax=Heterobasidion irregulare (strain TC 32-1) TaxID=747525 RepID=W4KG23_HETIT|nr:uncharacterized protein HETIRDRAFT_425936 [Heterobasidion irregulare TC 32-1]ETW84684.1 hypothetical protein HETIRDRAFT_425936 [Heterobasidion irregulare TC 32-1]